MSSKIKITSIFLILIIVLMAMLPGVFAVLDIDFVVNGDAAYAAPEPEVKLEYDEDDNYYYVEMGTYGGSPVRWRYVADVTDGVASATRFVPSASNKPDTSDGKRGMFVLETYAGTHDFNSDYSVSTANDYAASDIRKYLSGTESTYTDYKGNTDNTFITDLNISANNTIYTRILARSCESLYKDINWDCVDTKIVSDGSTTDTTSDKFWLLSVKEVYTLLGGATVGEDNVVPSDWSSVKTNNVYRQNTTDESGVWYWIRSPHPSYTHNVLSIDSNGDCGYDGVDAEHAARPAFILNFTEPGTMQYDETDNYYYMEMGQYNGEPVRWRYVADATNGVDNATRFVPSSTNAPDTSEGKKGMFILESDIFTAETLINGRAPGDLKDGIIEYLPSSMYNGNYHTTSGYTDIKANDYAASNLRAFLTGRKNVAGQDVGNLMDVIGIDSDNELYQRIKGRSLSDLYLSINQDGSTLTLPSQFEGTTIDKFWSLSYIEALTILGGGSSKMHELIWKSPSYSEYMEYRAESEEYWIEEYWNGFYWSRSPDSSKSSFAYYVHGGGAVSADVVNYDYFAARPAFIYDFTEPLVKYDSENNYYYLEMGTYGGSPVRWRYVSDVTNAADGDDTLANAVRFDPTTSTPNSTTGAKGMFILESDIFTAETLINGRASTDTNDGIIEFLPSNMYASSNDKYYHTTKGYTDVYANDYAASNIRAFLTGRTNVAGQDVGNLMNVIGIDSTNAIYQKIQGRTLTDLYSSINKDSSTLTIPSQFDGSATDMFWSLSYDEALTILGGGDTMQNELLWKEPSIL